MGGRGPETLRLFVAAYPTPETARAMLRLAALHATPGARAVEPGRVHLTLVFLGETRVSRLGEVIESIQRAASGMAASCLEPDRLVTLPAEAGVPPRLLAMTARAPGAVVELQRRLAHRLVEPSRRGRGGWLPHFTLARFEAGAGGSAPAVDVAVPAPPEGPGPIEVRAIALMQSVQGPGGAEHRCVAEVALGG